MSNLFDECPDALVFCEKVLANLKSYALFDGEEFSKTAAGILASNSIDQQGECFVPAALESMVAHIEHNGLWMLANHDPSVHPIGRVVAAKLFFADSSKTWFVAAITGFYNSSSLPSFKDCGIQTDFWEEQPEFPPVVTAQVTVGANRHEVNIDQIHSAVAKLPGSRFEETFRKGLDSVSILTISVSIYALLQTPFLKKFQERLGEKAADETLVILGWIKDEIVVPLFKRQQRRTLVEIAADDRGCRVQFLIDSADPENAAAAVDALPQAAANARLLLNRIQDLQPQNLVYLYDSGAKRWFPLHAATRGRGVITDRPALIALEQYKGFSLGGSSHDER